MRETRLAYLLDRYVHRLCTEEEKQELMALMDDPANDGVIRDLVDKIVAETGIERTLSETSAAAILQTILGADTSSGMVYHQKTVSTRRIIHRRWLQVAAVLITAAGLLYLFADGNGEKDASPVVQMNAEISVHPGGDRAYLTTADGRTVSLDSLSNGVLGGVQENVVKEGGMLTYTPLSAGQDEVAHNTLSTPRGGQFAIVLSDGTKIWLNASSSLYYPTFFTGSEREVALTGEAYFEVAPDKQKPFLVNVGDMRVEVLGTHFNVNAYSNESAIRTTLLEGSVVVRDGTASAKLRPGQEGVVSWNDGQLAVVDDADIATAVAWKHGMFQFSKADIQTVMRQVSRWYNVDVIYGGELPKQVFDGKISRSAELSDMLEILKLSDVELSVEGNKIMIH